MDSSASYIAQYASLSPLSTVGPEGTLDTLSLHGEHDYDCINVFRRLIGAHDLNNSLIIF